MKIELKDLQSLRKKTGVYFLYDKNKNLVYIGFSGNMYIRILEHIAEDKKDFSFYKAIEFKNIKSAQFAEIKLISIYKPKYNKLVCDDFNNLWSLIYSIVEDNIDIIELNAKTDIVTLPDKKFQDNHFKRSPFNCIYKTNEEYMIDLIKDI